METSGVITQTLSNQYEKVVNFIQVVNFIHWLISIRSQFLKANIHSGFFFNGSERILLFSQNIFDT